MKVIYRRTHIDLATLLVITKICGALCVDGDFYYASQAFCVFKSHL
jgi:hypothetical protein